MTASMRLFFLYQTQTILQKPPRICSRRLVKIFSHGQRRHISSRTEDQLGDGDGSRFFQEKAKQRSVVRNQPSKLSITNSERKALENALDAIRHQTGTRTKQIRRHQRNDIDQDFEQIVKLFSTPTSNFESKSQALFPEDFEKLHRNGDQVEAESSLTQVDSLGVKTQKLYDEANAVSSNATFATAEEGSVEANTEENPISTRPDHESERLAHEEFEAHLLEISQLYHTAINSKTTAGDIALWQVLESKVFPMVQNFQSHQTSKNASANKGPLTKTSIYSTQTLTRLYPASLLLCLRLYSKHFPTSPFPNFLLTQIRSLGPTSYIIGANTYFYNDLISFKWKVFSNLREIHDLISEMEQWGVSFDQGTYIALLKISEDKMLDLLGTASSSPASEAGMRVEEPTGSRGKTWWKRNDHVNWYKRVVASRKVVARQLEEQGLGDVLREGVFGDFEKDDFWESIAVNASDHAKITQPDTVWI